MTRERLTENFAYIHKTINRWTPAERERFASFIMQSCEVVVLSLSNVDEAFQMFDSQNTRGKALDPSDLLKAYHIREMDSDAVSEDTKRRMVAIWEDIRPAEVSALFADYLFKIKRWSSGRDVPDSGLRAVDIDVFKGVRENTRTTPTITGRDRCCTRRTSPRTSAWRTPRWCASECSSRSNTRTRSINPSSTAKLSSPQSGTTTNWRPRTGCSAPGPARRSSSRDHVLDEHRNDTRYGLTRNLFDNLLLYYVDRFGEQDLESAVRLIARYAVAHRARHYAVKRSMVNRYALSEPNLFREIRDSIRPREICGEPSTGRSRARPCGRSVTSMRSCRRSGDGGRQMSDDTAAPMLVSRLFDGTRYRVPLYQRAFAWGADEIEALFTDIRDMSDYSPNGHYYIGTLVAHRSRFADDGYPTYDVVDGQQRLTTLFLAFANPVLRESSAHRSHCPP